MFSHEIFGTEKDLNIYIRDNEEFYIETYRTKGETKLGYYFIKYLRENSRKDHEFLVKNGLSLPKEMPPYIPLHSLIQNSKNQFTKDKIQESNPNP